MPCDNLPECRDLDTRLNRGDRDMSMKLVIDPFTAVSPRLLRISRLFVRAFCVIHSGITRRMRRPLVAPQYRITFNVLDRTNKLHYYVRTANCMLRIIRDIQF